MRELVENKVVPFYGTRCSSIVNCSYLYILLFHYSGFVSVVSDLSYGQQKQSNQVAGIILLITGWVVAQSCC